MLDQESWSTSQKKVQQQNHSNQQDASHQYSAQQIIQLQDLDQFNGSYAIQQAQFNYSQRQRQQEQQSIKQKLYEQFKYSFIDQLDSTINRRKLDLLAHKNRQDQIRFLDFDSKLNFGFKLQGYLQKGTRFMRIINEQRATNFSYEKNIQIKKQLQSAQRVMYLLLRDHGEQCIPFLINIKCTKIPLLFLYEYDEDEEISIYKINKKIQKGDYQSLLEFEEDFQDMINYGMLYYHKNIPILRLIRRLQHNFRHLMFKVLKINNIVYCKMFIQKQKQKQKEKNSKNNKQINKINIVKQEYEMMNIYQELQLLKTKINIKNDITQYMEYDPELLWRNEMGLNLFADQNIEQSSLMNEKGQNKNNLKRKQQSISPNKKYKNSITNKLRIESTEKSIKMISKQRSLQLIKKVNLLMLIIKQSHEQQNFQTLKGLISQIMWKNKQKNNFQNSELYQLNCLHGLLKNNKNNNENQYLQLDIQKLGYEEFIQFEGQMNQEYEKYVVLGQTMKNKIKQQSIAKNIKGNQKYKIGKQYEKKNKIKQYFQQPSQQSSIKSDSDYD